MIPDPSFYPRYTGKRRNTPFAAAEQEPEENIQGEQDEDIAGMERGSGNRIDGDAFKA
jgi:hypothetical protein